MPDGPSTNYLDDQVFPHFRPTSAEIAPIVPGYDRGDVGSLDDLRTQVQRQHGVMMDHVLDEVAAAAAPAADRLVLETLGLQRKAGFVLAALEWLGLTANELNHERTDYPRSVDLIQQDFDSGRHGHFNADQDDPDYFADRRARREYVVSMLHVEYAALDRIFDEQAIHAAAMIQRPLNPDDLRMIFHHGANLPLNLFPDLEATLTYEDWKAHQMVTGGDLFAIPAEYHSDVLNDPDPAVLAAMRRYLDDFDISAAEGEYDGGSLSVFDFGLQFEGIVTYGRQMQAHPELHQRLPQDYLDYLQAYVTSVVDSHDGDLGAIRESIEGVDREAAINRDSADAPPAQPSETLDTLFADALRVVADERLGGSADLLPQPSRRPASTAS